MSCHICNQDRWIMYICGQCGQNLCYICNEIKNNNSPDDIDGSGLDGLKAQIVLEAAVQSIKKIR